MSYYLLAVAIFIIARWGEMSAQDRKALLTEVEKMRQSRVLLYVTGDRLGQETIIHRDAFDHFVEHLDAIGVTKRISLIIYTQGGDGMAAWSLFNLLRMFCDDLEVIVPMKAHSAGTMMAIGADKIIMTKQATLSPIDPSINHALAPQVVGAPAGTRAPVSVEAIKGYLNLAEDTLGKNGQQAMAGVMLDLARQVHPLVLGDTYRRRQQTQVMAEKLLAPQVKTADNRKKIISFLSSDSGSHDYTLNRREAEGLGLPVVKCPDKLYPVINHIYANFRDEMKLRTPFNVSQFPPNAVTPFLNLRATIESTAAAPVQYVTEGTFSRQPVPPPNVGEMTSVEITAEGWR
jgi:Serine dehydrogenase proteinase